ncbi:hypothetical protein Peur_054890 [Populus x canadensis]
MFSVLKAKPHVDFGVRGSRIGYMAEKIIKTFFFPFRISFSGFYWWFFWTSAGLLILPLLFSLPHVVAGLGHGGLFKMLNSLASLYLLCACEKTWREILLPCSRLSLD